MPLDFSYEKKLIKQGYKIIAGVDEVGRGPLAGPVTACAVYTTQVRPVYGLRDSKKFTAQKREEFYDFFIKEAKVNWAVSSIYPKIIDRVNIFEATKLATKRAVLKLEKKIGKDAGIIILDGKTKINLQREQVPIIKGDEKIALCAIASIIAKVTRDRAMLRYHKKFPEYRFDLHKGYGTKLHFAMLMKHGPSPIHRMSFNPLSKGN